MALCSTILNGISLSCDKTTGGIDKFWIAVQSDVKGSIQVSEQHKVTAVDAAGGNHWKEYQCRAETSTVTWAGVEGVGKGVAYWNYTVNIVIEHQDGTKNLEVEQLAREPLAIIYEDNNGRRWLLGDVRGAKMLPATAGDFGTAYTDANQYTLQFECPMLHLAYELATDTKINPPSEEE